MLMIFNADEAFGKLKFLRCFDVAAVAGDDGNADELALKLLQHDVDADVVVVAVWQFVAGDENDNDYLDAVAADDDDGAHGVVVAVVGFVMFMMPLKFYIIDVAIHL
ncbi:hypothetical protein EVAR_74158_1 [Eumeta japonica]|uniref:Uncharacterized protein n=1 Tax=Eumeta variegata TaxID=151549 RepID=A0A4C1TPN0_EUMVA|nr:hypothetical protein EVAR_74158_1 [Eumeta japonica]